MGYLIDRSRVGFVTILEANPGNRISYTKRSNNSSEAMVGDWGDLKPDRLEMKVQRVEGDKGNRCALEMESIEAHLMYHIHKDRTETTS